MSHLQKQKSKLLARIRRIKGQIEAAERALESDASCADVLQLLAATRGAFNGLTGELIEEHLREHVLHAESEADRRQGADELASVIRTYMK